MKIRYTFTVVREIETKGKRNIQEEIDYFAGVKDEAGEYLYGGGFGKETIDVKMEIQKEGKWEIV